jgi:hypothetical protein
MTVHAATGMAADDAGNLAPKILRAAWMSIVLGMAIEVALIVTAVVFGKAGSLSPFLADLAGKMSWSVLVCVGISIGTAAAGAARAPIMGLLGLISAPVGFTLAKVAHKSAAQALDVAMAASTSGPTPGQLVVIRALEYAVLGFAVGHISRKPWGKLPVYAALGLGMGLTVAALVLTITIRTSPAPPPPFALASKGVNEVLFPLGCSMVLYAVNALGRRVRLTAAV